MLCVDRIQESGGSAPVTHAGYRTGAYLARGLAVAALAIAVSGCSVKLKELGLMDDGAAPEPVAYMMTDPGQPASGDVVAVPASAEP